jgi:hypothetical protein
VSKIANTNFVVCTGVYDATLFKILNDVLTYILLDS